MRVGEDEEICFLVDGSLSSVIVRNTERIFVMGNWFEKDPLDAFLYDIFGKKTETRK